MHYMRLPLCQMPWLPGYVTVKECHRRCFAHLIRWYNNYTMTPGAMVPFHGHLTFALIIIPKLLYP